MTPTEQIRKLLLDVLRVEPNQFSATECTHNDTPAVHLKVETGVELRLFDFADIELHSPSRPSWLTWSGEKVEPTYHGRRKVETILTGFSGAAQDEWLPMPKIIQILVRETRLVAQMGGGLVNPFEILSEYSHGFWNDVFKVVSVVQPSEDRAINFQTEVADYGSYSQSPRTHRVTYLKAIGLWPTE